AAPEAATADPSTPEPPVADALVADAAIADAAATVGAAPDAASPADVAPASDGAGDGSTLPLITHRLLMVDNGGNKLIYLNQKEAAKSWSVAIPAGSRDPELVAGDKVLV